MDSQHPVNPEEQGSHHNLTGRDLKRITNLMSVILGYTQILKRRVRRGQTIDDEELDRVLGLIEHASRTLITELTQVAKTTQPDDVHLNSDR